MKRKGEHENRALLLRSVYIIQLLNGTKAFACRSVFQIVARWKMTIFSSIPVLITSYSDYSVFF
ncbi:MAG TPA: hypothetical protein HPP81_07235 [Deltaproteobacteria bacterium]|nr:hypothetical protein [Deltaproteobacteria bacterium]